MHVDRESALLPHQGEKVGEEQEGRGQPIDVLEAGLARAGVTELAEVWCHAPPRTVGDRYAARLASRTAGHPGAEYVPELIVPAKRAIPTGLAPCHAVDTTQAVDIPVLTDWLKDVWGNRIFDPASWQSPPWH